MPSDFGEIAKSQLMYAARYKELAQAAYDRGSYSEAEYLSAMAARYTEAAQEQKIAQRPGPFIVQQTSRRQRPERRHTPFVAFCVLPVLHGVGQFATAIYQRIFKRSDHELSSRS
jgi:hypothetical protein